MPGWRIGFAAGNQKLIGALARVKSYLDYGAFTAGCRWRRPPRSTARRSVSRTSGLSTRQRRDVLIDGLQAAGWEVPRPAASMFAWAPIPERYRDMGSLEFSKMLLRRAKVAVAPGVGFGEYGDGHVRLALVENRQRIRQAVRNIKAVLGQSRPRDPGRRRCRRAR